MSGLNALHRILLRFEPEVSHDLALRGLRAAQATPLGLRLLGPRRAPADHRLQVRVWGRRFANPVGVAAGFDKNGQAVAALAALGFGFVEVGTVTPMPQRGNPRPRLFRHVEQRSLQNMLGFNNRGVAAMRQSLSRQHPFPVPVGVNIGMNRATPVERAAEDYLLLVERLEPLADYFVINISSPNTPGLRELQEKRWMTSLLQRCRERTARPVLVKLAPDLADGLAVDLASAAVAAGAAGIVITNTTVDYSLLPGALPRGGLSGRVLKQRSFEMLRLLARELAGRCVLVSVGGIETPQDVYMRLRAGASLVQLYTALVFEGPLLARRLASGLAELLERDGVNGIEEIAGVDAGRSADTENSTKNGR